MAIGRTSAAEGALRALWRSGAIGLLTDGELLDRFLGRGPGSEAAFEALVERHGPMVLAVCRQALGGYHDAEDAFQGTFLVLVRRAGAVRKRDSVGSWLHGVALKVAARARSEADRRQRREGTRARERAAAGAGVLPGDGTDLLASLHEEIGRLPEKYRAPVVLCALGGQTHEEAARQLNWPVGTVSGRLSRARALLRGRFARRGLALPVTWLGAGGFLVDPRPASAALVTATARAALSLRLAGPGVAPTAASALAGMFLKARLLARVKVAAAVALTAGVGVGFMPTQGATRPGTNGGAAVAARLLTPETPRDRHAPKSVPLAAQKPGSRCPLVLGWHGPGFEQAPWTPLAFAPDGKTVASGGRDATVTLWDLETNRPRTTLRGHSAPVLALSFSPDGGSLASADADLTLKVWDLASGRERVSVTWSDPPAEPEARGGAEAEVTAATGPAPDSRAGA